MSLHARAPGSPRSILAALFIAMGMMSGAAGAAETRVLLQRHEQRPWTLPSGVERLAIANPDVADIVELGKKGQALLVGKSAGTTTLLVWQHGQDNPQRIQVEVRSAIQDQLLQGSTASVVVNGGQALLSGSTPSLIEHEQARKAAMTAAGDKGALDDVSSVSSGGMVQVQVRVVEFSRSTLKQLGLNFSNANGGFSYGVTSPSSSGSGGSDGTGNALSSAFSLVANSLTHGWKTSLDLLESNGMARVLAEPTLVALSGQSASFLAGGELPILEPQGLGTTTITYKPFGIGLTVTPTVLASDRIALKVAPEASDLDYSNSVMLDGVQVPAITTRRADTTIELGDGESFVIGGLISSNLTSTIGKIPLLGDLPIIGSFFRNLNYKRQDKELVIVVTPHLVQPLAKGTPVSLPGERQTSEAIAPWGAWLLYPAGPDTVPGFSR